MYVIAEVTLQDVWGNEAEYEVGAEVEVSYLHDGRSDRAVGYDVGEPDISAPDCTLKCSRIVAHEDLAHGWSDVVEEKLVEAFTARQEEMYEDDSPDPDEYDLDDSPDPDEYDLDDHLDPCGYDRDGDDL